MILNALKKVSYAQKVSIYLINILIDIEIL